MSAYNSPEIAQNLKVSEKSNIWSLGVVIYQLLTGKLPFSSQESISADEPTQVT